MTDPTTKARDKEENDRLRHALGELQTVALMSFAPLQEVSTIVHDAIRAMKRAEKRNTTLPAGYERVEIPQSRGPLLEFTGRRLCDHTFQPVARTRTDVTFELWETQGGAYVAVTFTEPEGGRDLAEAVVVPPGGDEQARRFAVMDHWEWTDRARTMVRKLGWTLREDVD